MKIFFFKPLLYNNLNPWIKREREKTLKLHHLLQFNAWHSYESDLYFAGVCVFQLCVYVYFSWSHQTKWSSRYQPCPTPLPQLWGCQLCLGKKIWSVFWLFSSLRLFLFFCPDVHQHIHWFQLTIVVLLLYGLNKVYLHSWKYGQSKSLYEH